MSYTNPLTCPECGEQIESATLPQGIRRVTTCGQCETRIQYYRVEGWLDPASVKVHNPLPQRDDHPTQIKVSPTVPRPLASETWEDDHGSLMFSCEICGDPARYILSQDVTVTEWFTTEAWVEVCKVDVIARTNTRTKVRKLVSIPTQVKKRACEVCLGSTSVTPSGRTVFPRDRREGGPRMKVFNTNRPRRYQTRGRYWL